MSESFLVSVYVMPMIKTVRLNGELVPLGRNSALKLMHQKFHAQKYPGAYPQFSYRLRFSNAVCRLFSPRKRLAFFR